MSSRIKASILVTIALAAGPRSVRAQDSLVFKGADRETSAALVKIVSEASARGLPTDHIVSKVQFALVVHAPPARILETAQAVADRLETARVAIASDTLSHDIAAGEDALSFKISKDILTRIHRAAPNRSIAVPLGLLTQLVASHVPAERASEIVTDLMRRGATPAQFADLGNEVSSDVARGARGAESVEIRFRGLTPLLPPFAAVNAADINANSPVGPKKP